MALSYLLFLFAVLNFNNASAKPITIILSCIPIRDCHYVYNLTKQSPDVEGVFQLLRKIHCGFDDSLFEPKVWCKLNKEPQKCSNNTGTCLPKAKCDINIDSEWITNGNSKENQCGEDNTHICCTDEKNQERSIRFPPPGVCGIHPDTKKIFGGDEAELDEFTWMGILQYKKQNRLKQACSASLINREFLITAAHCADPVAIQDMGYEKLDSVVLGEYNTETEIDCIEYDANTFDCADKPKIIPIKSVILHPQWDYTSASRENDIALVKLHTPIDYTDFIKPICLPFDGWTPTNTDHLYIAGWGKSPTEKRTAIKMKAVVHHTQCLYENAATTQLCAGGNKGSDICSGDSGGPLMLGRFVNRYYFMFLGGIASFGVGRCGRAPSVYTFVPSYIDWIRDVVEK